MTMSDPASLCIRPSQTLREAMICVNKTGKGIAIVLDEWGRLLYTITDGDLRRVLLHDLSLEMTIEEWANRRAEQGNIRPTTAPVGTRPSELLSLMQTEMVRHVPLLDEEGRVTDLVSLDDLLALSDGALSAVVMAGGFGTRLLPMTIEMPKPMLPVGDRPVIEHIVNQLRAAGVMQVSITTHYKPETIMAHFGNGQKFGIHIDYVKEDHPLGTAGALGLMAPWTSTLLVINGDVLTRLNYQSMLAFHQDNRAMMTVAVRQYEMQVPYGVVDMDGVEISGLREKPRLRFFVNAGVYLLEPSISRHFVPGRRMDMTDLILTLLDEKQRIVSFPISEYWLDIGQHEDYQRAQTEFEHGDVL